MKSNLLISIIALALLQACSPVAYTLLLDTRKPSSCGADIEGKTLSFIYAEPEAAEDSLFSLCFSDGFAQGLEQKYYSGKKMLDMLSLKPVEGSDYSTKDSLIRFVMETGSDVVMFMDVPELNYCNDKDSIEYRATVYLYDSMDEADVVRKSESKGLLPIGSKFASDSQVAGYVMSGNYIGRWVHEQFTLLYYESFDNGWVRALERADALEWDKAMDIWLEMTKKYTGVKLSILEYNIATACYLAREYKLASEWLDRSDAECYISLSKGLRTRIDSKLSK